ncbi:hypothetical protein Efla_006604 [Eimeria flavescens]
MMRRLPAFLQLLAAAAAAQQASAAAAAAGQQATAAAQQAAAVKGEAHAEGFGLPTVELLAFSEGAESGLSETAQEGGLKLSSSVSEQNIRPYNNENNATPVPYCHDCFGQTAASCRVCLHGEHASSFLMPMTPAKGAADRAEQSFAALETNHNAVKNLNKTFYMKRGEGPFGSLGNKPIQQDAEGSSSFLESDNISNTLDLELGLAETSVPIMQMKDSQYCGMLGIGTPPQWVRPIFDTGSTNLWVVGSKCTDDTCTKVTQFDPSKSQTFQYTSPPVHLDITFGTGRIQGTTGVDNFQIGPFTVKSQTFGLVESEGGHNQHGNIFKSIDFEGIVGMGFPEMSSTGATPIYDNIMNQAKLKRNEFAFYVAKGSPVSALFFGGVDPRFYEPPIHMFPVEREHYWEVALDAIYVGEKKFCCADGTKNYVILDSGTSFNTMPGAEMRSFLDMIPSQECSADSDDFLKDYPDITYVIGGVSFVLKPEDYLVRSKANVCKPAYMQIDVPSDFGHAYILGSVAFMRHFYTVYRRSDGTTPSLVGIARAVHSDENKQFLQQVVNAYPSGSFHEEDLLAVQRSSSSVRPLLLQEDAALRETHSTTI